MHACCRSHSLLDMCFCCCCCCCYNSFCYRWFSFDPLLFEFDFICVINASTMAQRQIKKRLIIFFLHELAESSSSNFLELLFFYRRLRDGRKHSILFTNKWKMECKNQHEILITFGFTICYKPTIVMSWLCEFFFSAKPVPLTHLQLK